MNNISNRGTTKELSKIKISSLVISMLYPTVLGYTYETVGKDGAVDAIRNLGKESITDFLEIYNKKRNRVEDIIKDFFKIYYDNKVKVKKENDRLYHVTENNCIVCQDIALEGMHL